MFFVFDTYKALSFIARCSNITRYTITFSFLSLIIFVWWYFCYTPMGNNILSYKQKINYLNNQKKKLLEVHSKYNLLKQEVETLNLKFSQQINSACFNCEKTLAFIIECCTKNKLKLDKYAAKEVTSKKWYTQNLFEFTLHGSYLNIVNFFESLSHSDSFIECVSCNLSSAENNNLSLNLVLKVLTVNQKGKCENF